MKMKKMNKTSAAVLAAVLTGSSWGVLAATLTSMDVASLPGEKAELKLSFEGTPPTPRSYSIEQPARIAIDLPGVDSELPKYNDISVGQARSATVVQAKDRTRMVINLERAVPYGTRIDGNHLYITLGEAGPKAGAQNSSAPEASLSSVSNKKTSFPAKKAAAGSIQAIDFDRGAEGEGNVVIKLASGNVPLDMQESGGKIVLRFPGGKLPASLRNRLDVIGFATPVQYIDAMQLKDGSQITVDTKGYFDYLAYQTDDVLTLSVKPLKASEVEKLKKDRFTYTGDKLSLNFQDIDVRSVLQLIADFTDLNLVASDTVSGNITLRLQNVPWDQALDLILKAKGLDKRQVGNVLMVAPAEEIAARERQELENQKQISELAPLFTEVFRVNYHDAQAIFDLFKGAGDTTNSILSERGEVIVDSRSNSIILKETQDKLQEFRDLLEVIDVPVRQVQIEARIVNASTNFTEDLGIEWSASKNFNASGSSTKKDIGVGVDLGATSPTGTLSLGFLTNSSTIDLELSALKESGGGEIISQPKLITSDKTTAKIRSGEEIPYLEASSSGATSVSFKEAALSLEVTPQITPEGKIILEVKVNNDSRGEDTVAGPAIDTQEISTQVLVDDGETLVIGGVFKQDARKSVNSVPFFGDLPVVGRLFRREFERDNKDELIVFLTPKVINSQTIVR